jgi:hypothetical protein
VSKKNLKTSCWCIKNHQKQNRIEKFIAPKIEGVKNSKKQATKCCKGWFPNTQKIPFILICCYQNSKMIYRTLGGILITF